MTCHMPRSILEAFRRAALPLACYYTVTLLMPLANGAAQVGLFVNHALVVLVVPPVVILTFCIARAMVRFVTRALTRTGLPSIRGTRVEFSSR